MVAEIFRGTLDKTLINQRARKRGIVKAENEIRGTKCQGTR